MSKTKLASVLYVVELWLPVNDSSLGLFWKLTYVVYTTDALTFSVIKVYD